VRYNAFRSGWVKSRSSERFFNIKINEKPNSKIGQYCGSIPLKNMEEIKNENLNSENEAENQDTEEENLETTTDEDSPEVAALKDKNRQLFERAKKAEGFVKQEDGTWVKKPKPEVKTKPEDKPQPQPSKPIIDDDVIDKKVEEKLEQRELESLEISDELKQEVKTYAKAAGLTVKQVLKSDYYQFLKQKDEAKQKIDEASIGGKKRGTPSGKDFSSVKPSDFDLSTKEGRDGWDEYKKWLKKQG